MLDALPTGNRYQNLLSALPGVVVGGAQDVGGSRGDSPTDISVHGSNVSDGRIMIDGANVAHRPREAGTTRCRCSTQSTSQEVVVSTSGGLGEAQTAGITINVIPREGGNTFRGQLFSASGANGSWQGSNYTQSLQDQGLRAPSELLDMYEVNPMGGGRIIRDRLWFYTLVPARLYEQLGARHVYQSQCRQPERLERGFRPEPAGVFAIPGSNLNRPRHVAGDPAQQDQPELAGGRSSAITGKAAAPPRRPAKRSTRV